MYLLSSLRSLLRRSHRQPRPGTRKPTLEPLEDRLCLSYTVIDLGTLGGALSEARAVNSLSQVVGKSATASGEEHAFRWQDGAMTDLGTLGGAASVANDVNNAGQIAGASEAASGGLPHAFIWENGVMTDLGTLGGAHSEGHAINSAGQIAGVSETAGGAYHAFLWEGGTMYDLNSLLPSGASLELTFATDINDNGQIVGQGVGDGLWRAFLLTDDDGIFANGGAVLTDLGTLGGAEAEAFNINGFGQVVGWAHAADGWPHAFRYASGAMTDLGTLGGNNSYANAINDADQVVGTSQFQSQNPDGAYHAFLWQNGAMTDLNEQLPSGSTWTLEFANDINSDGHIVGDGIIDGQRHAFLMIAGTSAPTFSIDDVTVTEGNSGTTTATFTVSLSAASDQTVTVDFAAADGSAVADIDYQPLAGTLTFAAGETTKMVTVPVNGDRLGEPNETFFINLSSSTNATIADGQGVGSIADDEPRISISDVARYEGKRGKTTLFTFTVTLSAAYDQAVTMSFATVNGTATTGNGDYLAKTGTISFMAGETTKTITITVKGDSKKEGNETFYLDLFGNSGNALFTKNRGLGTILNDD